MPCASAAGSWKPKGAGAESRNHRENSADLEIRIPPPTYDDLTPPAVRKLMGHSVSDRKGASTLPLSSARNTRRAFAQSDLLSQPEGLPP